MAPPCLSGSPLCKSVPPRGPQRSFCFPRSGYRNPEEFSWTSYWLPSSVGSNLWLSYPVGYDSSRKETSLLDWEILPGFCWEKSGPSLDTPKFTHSCPEVSEVRWQRSRAPGGFLSSLFISFLQCFLFPCDRYFPYTMA